MALRASGVGGASSIPGLQAALDSKADKATTPQIVAASGLTNQSADINQPTLYAVPTSGMYRISAFMVQTVAATTSSTLPSLNVQYTEATSGVAMSDQVFTSSSLNQVGAHQSGVRVILAQQGSQIGYVTGGYASDTAAQMRYAVQLKIEFLG